MIGMIYFPLTYGNLNLPACFSDILGNTNTPKQTNTNANKVPMLVKSVMIVLGINKEGMPTKKPVIIVANAGV